MVSHLGVLAAILLICLWRGTESKYVATATCSNTEQCEYSYSSSLIKMMNGTQSQLLIKTTVKAACESVGTNKKRNATRFCIDFGNTTIAPQEDMDREKMENTTQAVEELLKKPFCFIQTSNGKIVSVQHDKNETTSVANFKKGIVSAFQANFKRTTSEVESDYQSSHISHYSYKILGKDHLIMNRTVDSKSIIQFASHEHIKKPVNLLKSEVVEYKNGTLLSSRGTMKVIVNRHVRPSHVSFESFGASELSGTGEYSLKLEKCYPKPPIMRRSVNSLELTESNIHAVFEKDKLGDADSFKLRKDNPFIKPLLIRLHKNLSDTPTSNKVRTILKLEADNGDSPNIVPARKEVVDYINLLSNSTNENDTEMRVFLYSLLLEEGSIESQQALLKAIQKSKNQKERNTLTVLLAFIKNVHPGTLSQLESLIVSSEDQTDTLVLSYGALASSLKPELKDRVISFLVSRINHTTDPSVLIHYIYSLGNTKSQMAKEILLNLLAHSTTNVKLAAVYALRFSTGSVDVQGALQNALEADPSEELTDVVLRSLIAGAESESQPISDRLFETILNASSKGNNTELKMQLAYYMQLLGSNVPNNWSDLLNHHLVKRGAMWNENNDEYDVVEDLDTRNSDVQSYPLNKAYIWGKMFGTQQQLGLGIGFGAFTGFGSSANTSSFKLFAKGIARAYAFGESLTFFEALMLSEKKPGATVMNNKLYVSIAGMVLADYTEQNEISLCNSSMTFPLFNQEYTIISYSIPIFIYVGILNFEVKISAQLSVNAELAACIRECASVKGGLVPSVTLSASAEVSASLLELARAGVSVTASFQYNIRLDLSGDYKLFSGPFQICLSLSHGWPDNKLVFFSYYQTREINMCSGPIVSLPCGTVTCYSMITYPCGIRTCTGSWGITYPCGTIACDSYVSYPCGVKMCPTKLPDYPCGFNWGEKHKWEAASFEWKLPSMALTSLWNICTNGDRQCPAIPPTG